MSFEPPAVSRNQGPDKSSRNLSRSFSQPGLSDYHMDYSRKESRMERDPHINSRSSFQRRSARHLPAEYDLTPKAITKTKQPPSFNVQPPTPSIAADTTEGGSKFSRLARGLARDISANKSSVNQEYKREASRRATSSKKSRSSRVPFQDVENTTKSSALKAAADLYKFDSSRSKGVQLPDVTGLTSAVGSPLKKDLDWRGYAGINDVEGVEGEYGSFSKLKACSISVISATFADLNHLTNAPEPA